MPIEIKHPYLNWVNGMKLSKEHFIALENSFIDHTRDMAGVFLTNINFGLLPMHDNTDPVHVEVTPDRVEVHRCQAITRGGLRIDVSENHNHPGLRKPMHEVFSGGGGGGNQEWFVIVKVNPFQRSPYGQPNAEETPIRHPFATSHYELSILPKDQISASHFDPYAIPVAKITDNYGGKRADELYIPPCASIQSMGSLVEKYHRFSTFTTQIEGSLFEIIKKAQSKQANRTSNTLSEDIQSMATKIVDFISLNKASYDLLLAYYPPVYIVEWFARMARIIKSSMRFLSSADAMMKYFEFYIKDTNPVAFQTVVDRACALDYNHLDVHYSFRQIEDFLTFLDSLFRNLKDLQFDQFANPTIIDRVTTTSNLGRQVPPPPPTPPPPTTRTVIRPKLPGNQGGGRDEGGTTGWGLDDD